MSKYVFAFWLCLLFIQPAMAQNTAADSSLINQMAEQNLGDPNTTFGSAFDQLINGTHDIDRGTENFIQSAINWFGHSFNDGLQAVITVLSNIVKSFFLNTNLANSPNNASDFSLLLKPLTSIIYGIAIDLMFVLFIFAIWQYWTKASWGGNVSAMSAVGRLIFALAVIISWKTIYSFEIDLSNDMINAILANGSNQISLFDMTMANMVNLSTYSGLSNLISMNPAFAAAIEPLNGIVNGMGIVVLAIFIIIVIYELIHLIILKAIQTALLTAQYVFAPVFLIFFASPSTENIASGYIRTFAETSVWSFIWIGLLKILFILLYASFNPWGKIITTIGILQLMLRVPEFLGRFKISAASNFVNPVAFTNLVRTYMNRDSSSDASYKSQFFAALHKVFKGEGIKEAFRPIGANIAADFKFGKNKSDVNMMAYPGKKIEERSNMNNSTHGHFKNDIPRTKRSPDRTDIFARHSRSNEANSASNPINKQESYIAPEQIAALVESGWSANSKALYLKSPGRGNSPSIVDPYRISPYNLGVVDPSFLPRIAYSQFGKLAGGFSMQLDRPKRLLSSQLSSIQMAYGFGSIKANKQQFALPEFARLLTQPSRIQPQKPQTNYSKINLSNSLAKGPKLLRNWPTAQSNLYTANKNSNPFNQYKSTFYYSSPAISPGWQRPYYRPMMSSGLKQGSTFYPGASRPQVPCFHSFCS